MTDYKELAARLRESVALIDRQRRHIEDMGRRIHNQRVQLRDTWETVEMRAGWMKGWPIQSRALAMAIAASKERRTAEARCKAQVEQAFRDGLAYATNVVVTDADEAWRTSRARLALQENTNGG